MSVKSSAAFRRLKSATARATLANCRWRRKAAREPRVVVREANGQPHALSTDDPRALAVIEAAERLISAAQRGAAG